MSKEQDRIFFRNFSFVLVALAIMMGIFVILALIFGRDQLTDEQRLSRAIENTAPIGRIQISGTESGTNSAMETTATNGIVDETIADTSNTADPASPEMETNTAQENVGKTVYEQSCFACHGTGIPGIPQLGDADAWAPRIGTGNEVLYDHAINGFSGSAGMPMPARGGNTSLSDAEVKAAVNYMISASQ